MVKFQTVATHVLACVLTYMFFAGSSPSTVSCYVGGVNSSAVAVNSSAVTPLGANWCRTTGDMYPGKFVGSRWDPDNCEIKRFTDEEMQSCLRERPWLGIGDSLAVYMLGGAWANDRELDAHPADPSWTPAAMNIWSPAAVSNVSTYMMKPFEKDLTPFIRDKVRTVLFSEGLWDIGAAWCGTDQYYANLRDKVLSYKAMVRADRREDVQLLLLDLPYIHHGMSGWVTPCNPVRKLEVYREIIHQVASCLNIGVFSYYGVQRQAVRGVTTTDGLHINGDGVRAVQEMMLNLQCGAGMEPTYYTMPCDEAALRRALQRWRKNTIANRASRGCSPYARYTHQCPKASMHNFTKYEVVGGGLSDEDRQAGRLPSETDWYKDDPITIRQAYTKKA